MDNQQQLNEELQERTELALLHAWNLGLPDEDLALLSWHSGVDYHKLLKLVYRMKISIPSEELTCK